MRLHPSPAAHSLVCFTCQNVKSNWYCLKPTICSDTDSYCVTVSASAGLSECGCWAARLPPQPPPPLLHSQSRFRWRRERGGLGLLPVQVLLPDLRLHEPQLRRGVHGYLLLPELPVQHQRGGPRAAGQHPCAGPGAPAQPAGGSAAVWTLTAQPGSQNSGRKESPDPRGSQSRRL